MFIPLNDDNPLRSIRFQFVTFFLVVTNILVFVVFQSGLFYSVGQTGTAALAIVPCELLGGNCAGGYGSSLDMVGTIPEVITPITYMFLHGSVMHLAGNMLFLWVFGDNVEDAMGSFTFLVFYLLCGIFAGYTHSMMTPASHIPLIGASGAVAGVIAAYLMLHPNVMVWVLALGALSMRLRAVWVLGAWVAIQFISLFTAGQSSTAWWAHIGGLFAGAILILFLRRPGVKLFQ